LATLSLKLSEGWPAFRPAAEGLVNDVPPTVLPPPAVGLEPLADGQPATVKFAGTLAVLSPFWLVRVAEAVPAGS
jgi:hypothetical protein